MIRGKGCGFTPTTATVGTEEELVKACKDNIDTMAKGGGFVLATGCELISPDAFPHAKKMVEIAKTYGVYAK